MSRPRQYSIDPRRVTCATCADAALQLTTAQREEIVSAAAERTGKFSEFLGRKPQARREYRKFTHVWERCQCGGMECRNWDGWLVGEKKAKPEKAKKQHAPERHGGCTPISVKERKKPRAKKAA